MRRATFCSKSCVHVFGDLPRVSATYVPLTVQSALQETDKATIDVEAQDDGVLGKIIVRRSVFSYAL